MPAQRAHPSCGLVCSSVDSLFSDPPPTPAGNLEDTSDSSLPKRAPPHFHFSFLLHFPFLSSQSRRCSFLLSIPSDTTSGPSSSAMLARPLLIPPFRPFRCLQKELPRQMASLCISPFQTLPASNEDLTALNGLTAMSPPTSKFLMILAHRLLFTKCSFQGACSLSLPASLDSSFTYTRALLPSIQTHDFSISRPVPQFPASSPASILYLYLTRP